MLFHKEINFETNMQCAYLYNLFECAFQEFKFAYYFFLTDTN